MSTRSLGQRTDHLTIAAGVLLVFALWGSVPQALGQDAMPLSGEMFIGGATPVDPVPPANTHGYFVVRGRAAQQLYANMRVRPEADTCRPERLIKVVGPLSCSVEKGGREPECDFSLNLLKGELAAGRAC